MVLFQNFINSIIGNIYKMDSLKCLNLKKNEYSLSTFQYKGVLTLLHKGGEREDIKKNGDH